MRFNQIEQFERILVEANNPIKYENKFNISIEYITVMKEEIRTIKNKQENVK